MNLDELLKDAYVSIKEIYKDDLVKVILYGSYARGDYHEYSDIDILALVKCSEEKIWELRDMLISAVDDLDWKYSALISLKIKSIDYFDRWKNSLPYFKNVIKDGREIRV